MASSLNGNGNGLERPNSPQMNMAQAGSDLGADESTTEFSIRDFLDVLLKGKWSILSSFAIVFVAVAVYTFLQNPEYEAHSTLMVDTKRQSKTMEDLIMGMGNRNVFNEVEILKSRTLANRVADRLILEAQQTGEQYSVLTTAEGAMPEPRKVAERLMGPFIDVRPMSKDVDMIRVTATSTDPAEAEKIANLYAEEYLSYNLQQSRRQMQEAGSFIEDQVQELEGEINTIE
ncbi:MAG: Wzz/FepE/Etk N-terminal domain-containing protein, partial [Bacteroidota bacterium]